MCIKLIYCEIVKNVSCIINTKSQNKNSYISDKKILLCLFNTVERDDKNAKTERLVIEDLDQRQRIVARVHDSGHLGINESLDMVASKYY